MMCHDFEKHLVAVMLESFCCEADNVHSGLRYTLALVFLVSFDDNWIKPNKNEEENETQVRLMGIQIQAIWLCVFVIVKSK